MLVIILVVCGGLMALRLWSRNHMLDGDGMVNTPHALMEITPYNSGTDELGESVGYGEGETVVYGIYTGDKVYEDLGDTLVVNPSMQSQEEIAGLTYCFTIKSVDEKGVTLRYAEDEDGSVASYSTAPAEEKFVEFGEKFTVSSAIFALDGPSTTYYIKFTPNE